MYIETNGTRYEKIKRFQNANSIIYTGESLTGIENVGNPISLYANDGFHLCDDNPSAFLRTVISEGQIQLTNVPEGYVPPPTVETRVSNLEQTVDTLLGVNE